MQVGAARGNGNSERRKGGRQEGKERKRQGEFYYVKGSRKGRERKREGEGDDRRTENGKEGGKEGRRKGREEEEESESSTWLCTAQRLKAGNFHLRNCY